MQLARRLLTSVYTLCRKTVTTPGGGGGKDMYVTKLKFYSFNLL